MLNNIVPIYSLWEGFDRTPVTAYSSQGTPYTRWVPYGMPQLGRYESLLDTVFYLYENEEKARRGLASGATGFVVSMPSERWPDNYHYTYAISNWHAVNSCGYSVIRINGTDGRQNILPFDPSEWYHIPNFHDISVIPLPPHLKLYAVSSNLFLTKQEIRRLNINAGDDIFMLGRFLDYDGIETNKPAMRFGNISINNAAIKQKTGYCGDDTIVADVHSRNGFSGSPVFVFRTLGSVIDNSNGIDLSSGPFLRLLGIHYAQFPEKWKLKTKDTKTLEEAGMLTEGKYVEGLSGMTCIAPSSAILDVLNIPQLCTQRAQNDQKLYEHFEKHGYPPILEAR